MDTLDYTASATLVVQTQGGSGATESGTLAEMVGRAVELNANGRSAKLEWDGTVLGFGLIEAIYQRPDFPRGDRDKASGWEGGDRRRPRARRKDDAGSLASRIFAKVAEATGRGEQAAKKPVVLIVEDEPLVRMLGADLLTEAGFQVVEAGDSDEAVHALAAHPEIQVVFTDVNMPGPLDGLKLASLMSERRPDLKVLVGSGVVRPADGQLGAGVRFMAKPYRPAAVVESIREMLQPSADDLRADPRP
jgi:CheY-like chemotaxis protein